MPATAPYNNSIYDLSADTCLQAGFTTRMEGKKARTPGETPVFHRLVAAGRRLMEVIQRNKGGANKDLARFAAQVQSLADKWDR